MSPESDTPKKRPPNAGKGRPKGAKNKRTLAVEQLADRMFDKAYERELKRRIRIGKAPHMEAFLASHKYGVPKKKIEHSGEIPPFVLMVDDDDEPGPD